jgi:hypothetical protein
MNPNPALAFVEATLFSSSSSGRASYARAGLLATRPLLHRVSRRELLFHEAR